MVKVNGVYYDGYLKTNLEILRKNVYKDWDFWGLVDGREGAGKSRIAKQCAFFVDPTFNIDSVVFTPKQFSKAVDTAPRYSAIVWDEAITGTQSTDMTKMARMLKSKAVQMRQKNLFVFLVLHSYYDMNKYYAVHRSWFLIHVYFVPDENGGEFKRGYFEFYDYKKKKTMYLTDKYRRFYDYSMKPSFRGRFTNTAVIDEKLYKEKKARIDDGDQLMDKRTFVEAALGYGVNPMVLEKETGITRQYIYELKRRLDSKS